jgi:hypothetical protein
MITQNRKNKLTRRPVTLSRHAATQPFLPSQKQNRKFKPSAEITNVGKNGEK